MAVNHPKDMDQNFPRQACCNCYISHPIGWRQLGEGHLYCIISMGEQVMYVIMSLLLVNVQGGIYDKSLHCSCLVTWWLGQLKVMYYICHSKWRCYLCNMTPKPSNMMRNLYTSGMHACTTCVHINTVVRRTCKRRDHHTVQQALTLQSAVVHKVGRDMQDTVLTFGRPTLASDRSQ